MVGREGGRGWFHQSLILWTDGYDFIERMEVTFQNFDGSQETKEPNF
jgi:hypothetical protein